MNLSKLLMVFVSSAPWSPVQDLNPHTVVRSHMFYPVRLTGDKTRLIFFANLYLKYRGLLDKTVSKRDYSV